jgi:hypothetical protein
MYKNNAAAVETRPLRGGLTDASRHLDRVLAGRTVVDYGAISPLLSAQDVFPRLQRWLDIFRNSSDPKHEVFAGSISVEAAVGAPHAKVRKTFLAQARRHLGDCSLDDIANPSDSLIRKNRVFGVTDLLATRRLTSTEYRVKQLQLLSQLDDRRRTAETGSTPYDSGQLGRFSGAVMEQTVLCLLHDPARGIVAVPSFMRQDENNWLLDGKKYRWDVTVESNGREVPEGQYRFQAKLDGRYRGDSSYHPDIIIVSGSKHLGENHAIGAIHQAVSSIIEGDVRPVSGYQDVLLGIMSDHGPSSPDLQYLDR